MRRPIWPALALALLTTLPATVGCKKKVNFYGRADEIKMGERFATQIEKEEAGKLVTSGPKFERLQKIAARILPLAKRDWDVPYKVHLIDSEEINAFAVPGGPIYFYTGLIDLAESDDEIASVLGHEASHVVKRHSTNQMSATTLAQAGALILLGGKRQEVQDGADLLIGLSSLKFSRDEESQADAYGFKYLVQAGYNPDAMATFFEKMQKKAGKGGGKVGEFFSSHPLTQSRIDRARERAAAYRAGKYQAP